MADSSDRPSRIPQGIARRLVPVRWPQSGKLAGYYDPDSHALIYQDARGQVVDRVELPTDRRIVLTDRVE